MGCPPIPITGTDVAENYDADLNQFMRDLEVSLKMNVATLRGEIKRVAGGGGGGTTEASSPTQYMCKMTSGYTSGADGFPVTVYDSLGGTALGNSTIGVPLIFLAANDSLPTTGWIIGNVISMSAIGDGTGV